jgi:hypothetical protein
MTESTTSKLSKIRQRLRLNAVKLEQLKRPAKRIILEQSKDCYIAKLNTSVVIWGKGKTPEEAIGNMVNKHWEYFGLAAPVDWSAIEP